MHSTTMIWCYPILGGFGNYLIPLMIGARDMAFPRLNALSYWTFLLSGLFLYGSTTIFQWPHGGWFAYVPYTNAKYSPGYGMDFYVLALIFQHGFDNCRSNQFLCHDIPVACTRHGGKPYAASDVQHADSVVFDYIFTTRADGVPLSEARSTLELSLLRRR